MQYESKEIKEDVDILVLNTDECKMFNDVFVKAIQRRYPYKKRGEIKGISRMIVTDALHRVEFVVKPDNCPSYPSDSNIKFPSE